MKPIQAIPIVAILIVAIGCSTLVCSGEVQPHAKAKPNLLVAPFGESDAREAIAVWAKHLGEAEQFSNRLELKLVLIPPGKFLMGSPTTEERRRESEEQHRVTVSRPFYSSATEVTQRQWKSVMDSAPWQGKRLVREGDGFAATYVNWDDASEFCQRLSEKERRTYRLPTEAEWEYACRAGTVTAYSFGSDFAQLNKYAWIGSNTFDADAKFAHLVGQKQTNPFGLHDMHGNVWEWCGDWYSPKLDEDDYVDPRGPQEGLRRVIRGGSWHGAASLCRSANRFYRRPDMRTNDVGFRVVCEPTE